MESAKLLTQEVKTILQKYEVIASDRAVYEDGELSYYKDEIDEDLLKEIADATGGKYFRATNNRKLVEIYDEINKLEKTEIEEFKYYNYQEKYRPLLMFAGFLILLEMLLRFTVYRSFI